MSQKLSETNYEFNGGGVVVGAQMLFVAFGALVLVPLLTGLDPNVKKGMGHTTASLFFKNKRGWFFRS